jgi:ribosomal protein S18 acetylase RimI-like enzyme
MPPSADDRPGPHADHPPVEDAPASARRELERPEARVAGATGRRLVDLGDAVLVHDEHVSGSWRTWLGDVRWPSNGPAFERRLIDALTLFATIDRRPSIWVQPGSSAPPDLAGRLRANGFAAAETAYRMRLLGPARESLAAAARDRPGLVVGVVQAAPASSVPTPGPASGVAPPAPASGDPLVTEAARVMSEAFGVTRPRLATELGAVLAVPGATLVVVRSAGEPVGAGRSFALDGVAYLSAIGVRPEWRGRGIGRFVTGVLARGAFEAGCRMVHLGVAVDNVPAWKAYAAVGFRALGTPASRLVLR